MRLILSLLLNGFLVFVGAQLLPGVAVDGYLTAIWTGLVLGLVNFFIKPITSLLTLPLTIVTLGLFMLVINGAMVLLADFLVGGFDVDGLGWAILFSVLLTLMNSIISRYQVTKRESGD